MHGRSLVRAGPGTLCVGIDPQPQVDREPVGTTISALTSDEFFLTCDLRAALGGRPVDLAFIDGLHSFEFA
jgi:hypothetical protein